MGLDTGDLQSRRGSVLSHNNESYADEDYCHWENFKSRSFHLNTLFTRKSKSDSKQSLHPRATFQHTCSTQSAGILAPRRRLS